MDALLSEISSKKQALNGHSNGTTENAEAGPSRKYMRRGEIEAEEERKEAEARRKKEEARETLRREKEARLARKNGGGGDSKKEDAQARNTSLTALAASSPGRSATGTPEPNLNPTEEKFNISASECNRRLRQKGQPIRLFGETDKDRRNRLRQLELYGVEKGGDGGRVDEFRKTLKAVEGGMLERDAERGNERKRKIIDDSADGGVNSDDAMINGGTGGGGGGSRKKKEEKREVEMIDLKVVKNDINKAYPLVYWAFKNVFKEWEEWMDLRDEDVKRTTAGKLALATQVQSGVNMKPLYKQLRSREMPPDVIYKLAELTYYMQQRQYQKANDAYLRLSIGNAAWPIGVTSVGLHERGAREKITEDTVAHVLNDEVSRKWIQAVKRLLTFSQTIRPPDEASQLMG